MQFLRGRFREPEGGALHPPWAREGAAFTDACTRCDDCIQACPSHILLRGMGGFPVVDFSRGECSFCGDCVAACATPALDGRDRGAAPWRLRASIGEACLALNKVVCRTCGEVCEPRAIRFHPSLGGVSAPLLNLDDCSGCGACVAPCPVGAVSITIPPMPALHLVPVAQQGIQA